MELQKIVTSGWPDERENVPDIVKKYWNFREEISFIDGLLFKGQKVIIPSEQKLLIMQKVHHGHFGIERTISLARDYFYWYGMTNDISEYVESLPEASKIKCEGTNDCKTSSVEALGNCCIRHIYFHQKQLFIDRR